MIGKLHCLFSTRKNEKHAEMLIYYLIENNIIVEDEQSHILISEHFQKEYPELNVFTNFRNKVI